MTTPPKAPCHSCNGTGIDPTVGFLDCEFCTPAFAGVTMSAPEQPEPKCATCNDHGEIGCLRPDGYDGEQCPDCNPATVKRYYVGDTGLVEGQALGRISVVLGADHDRVTADADRLRAELECSRGDFVQLERISERLQARLNTADQAVDEMVTLLNLAENILSEHRQVSPGYDWISNTQQDREEMRKQIAEYLINMCSPGDKQCQYPQSCPSNCGCDIPDFTPGNSNKARRRAESLGLTIPTTPTAYDGFDNGVD